ncbi:MAG TPA: hypothetical protein VH301_12575 [Usitatibacter sp.]|jgi:hypothetical protein|nr:hypothetical protein [Usitatibacter sp.]
MDDLRNHDANPNAQERQWMETNPFSTALRVMTLAAVALMIGVSSATLLNADPAAPAHVASVGR